MVVLLMLSWLTRRPPLEVGPAKQFSRIEDALSQAASGDEIDVYPSPGDYPKTALLIKTPVRLVAKGGVSISGAGFDYSGQGKIPRAIIQVDAGGAGTTIQGFKLYDAHNDTFNGAGVRIVEASDVSIERCEITANDMGIMSNGKEGDAHSAENQRIASCSIHDNGTSKDPGQNHNLYLGGASVYIDRCQIYDPITGHNLKSRSHLTSVTRTVIYGGNNRQIDCVDSWFTTLPHSDLFVYDSILAMNPNSVGNGNVIHFGQESGNRNGCAYLFQTSIYTEFLTPILTLDSNSNHAVIKNCFVLDPDPITPQFLSTPAGSPKGLATGSSDLFSKGYQIGELLISARQYSFGEVVSVPPAIPKEPSTGFAIKAWSGYSPSSLSNEGRPLESFPYPGAEYKLYDQIVDREMKS